MRIIAWDAGGKGGILEITKRDYQESLREQPHPGLRVHSETGTVPLSARPYARRAARLARPNSPIH